MIYRYANIGEAAREWRRDSNFTLSDIATRIGCTTQNITAFERGESVSGKILLGYVRIGFAIYGFVDDLFICGSCREL